MLNAKSLICRLGETDQLFLLGNSPELAWQRANLRLQLVNLSQLRQEQFYFLHEAIVILETARLEFTESTLSNYLALSKLLAQAYLQYFQLTSEKRFAVIMQQILKPLAHHHDAELYYMLAYAAAAQQQPSMTRHWLKKYLAIQQNVEAVLHEPVFSALSKHAWFHQLLKTKLS